MAHVQDFFGNEIDFEEAVNLMDDELREQVHAEMATCTDQDFIDRYADLHEQKFGEGFAPYTGEAW